MLLSPVSLRCVGGFGNGRQPFDLLRDFGPSLALPRLAGPRRVCRKVTVISVDTDSLVGMRPESTLSAPPLDAPIWRIRKRALSRARG